MRKLLLIGGAAALIALPSAALAAEPELIDEPDPTAEAVAGTTTTDKALHAEGKGGFEYEGSGGTVVTGRGVVKVKDLSAAKDLVKSATGFGTTKTSKDGVWTKYIGEGTLTLDGSSYKVRAAGRFSSDVDPTATHPATGQARAAGWGESILKGGVPLPFWASQRMLLTAGPMSVDLEGRGWHDGWWWKGDRRHKGVDGRSKYVVIKRVVITRKVQNGHTVSRRKVVTVKRRWDWDRRTNGATWRLNGPASGSVTLATISGRLRVWDPAKDLVVTGVPTGTPTTTLGDSVVYSGLRDVKNVTLTGTGFRMKVRARDVEGTFTPTPGSLARSFVQGRGTIDTASVTDYSVRKHRGVRVLLQPVAAK